MSNGTDPDKVKLTAEQKRRIKDKWFDYPLATRQRYWRETDYGEHGDYLSPGLIAELKLEKRKRE